MSYSTIFDLGGNILTDGVQSQSVCDATINTAKQLAADRGKDVVVEDYGTTECYRVSPDGRRRKAPKDWIPQWEWER